jgi:hypothetical protein
MLRVASLLTLLTLLSLPSAGVLAQSPIRVVIGDSASAARYEFVSGSDTTSRSGAPRIYGIGRAVFSVPPGDSATVTVLSENTGPVRVQVSSPAGSLSAVGAIVTLRVFRDSVSVEARDRSGLTPAVLRRP